MRYSAYSIHLLATVVLGDFEWDDAKAASNLAKHGISFVEAATALTDPHAIFFSDLSASEARIVAIGVSDHSRALVVVHVERGARDRIISARRATRSELKRYETED